MHTAIYQVSYLLYCYMLSIAQPMKYWKVTISIAVVTTNDTKFVQLSIYLRVTHEYTANYFKLWDFICVCFFQSVLVECTITMNHGRGIKYLFYARRFSVTYVGNTEPLKYSSIFWNTFKFSNLKKFLLWAKCWR